MTMKQPQTCLTSESLRQLAGDEFSPAELCHIEQHVTECSHCRELLEAAESDSHWRNNIYPILRSPENSPHLADHPDEREHDEYEGMSLDSVLRLLGPTDDPRMLGRIGTYEVVGVIGRGGMGVVFKAYDAPLNRFVAIKMLLPHLPASGAARKRFAREGQAAAAVIDDHVMPIYSVAEWQGIPYLVTQYSGGTTLQKRIEQQGPLDVKEILRIGMQTARGLAAAHAQGLVHRDVKPSNILLDGTVERAMLTDFGLARAVDDASITRSGIIAGTPQYMSPEQARGGSVDARSDLFGLGCVLYAMGTGRPPFRADNSHAVLRLITDEEPRPIREINPDVPEWLGSIVSKLMSKQPGDRFGSAAEVAGLLESCLAHVQHPTTAPLPECCHLHRERRGFSRIARILTAIGFAGLLILAGVAIESGLGLAYAWWEAGNGDEMPPQRGTGQGAAGGGEKSTEELLRLTVIPSDQAQATRLLMEYDLNNDSVLNKSEMTKVSWGADMPKFDLDGNGQLTVLELSIWYANQRNEFGIELVDQRGANTYLARYDRNGDKELDQDEMKRGKWPLTPQGFDADGNGRLTAFEIAAEFSRRRRKRQEQGIEGTDQNYAISTVKTFDANGDRHLDENELKSLKAEDSNFDFDLSEADKNGDGKLEIEELARFFSAKRTARGVTPADQKDANTLLGRFDQNRNGVLDPSEIDDMKDVVPYDPRTFDSDNDGALTKRELEDGLVSRKRSLGVNEDDLKFAASLMLRYDRDRNGKINLAEVQTQLGVAGDATMQLSILAFVEFDRDFDQQLTVAEVAQYIAYRRKGGGQSANTKRSGDN